MKITEIVGILELGLAIIFILIIFFKKLDFKNADQKRNVLIYLWGIGCIVELIQYTGSDSNLTTLDYLAVVYSILYNIVLIAFRRHCLNFIYLSTVLGFFIGGYELFQSSISKPLHWIIYFVVYVFIGICLKIYSKRFYS